MRKKRFVTVDVPHPNHPEFVVTIKKPSPVDQIALADQVEIARTDVVRDEHGQPVIDKDGDPITYKRKTVPGALILKMVGTSVLTWRGYDDENGVPIPCNASTISELLDGDLTVTEEGKDAKLFAVYLLEKISDQALFDADPKA